MQECESRWCTSLRSTFVLRLSVNEKSCGVHPVLFRKQMLVKNHPLEDPEHAGFAGDPSSRLWWHPDPPIPLFYKFLLVWSNTRSLLSGE